MRNVKSVTKFPFLIIFQSLLKNTAVLNLKDLIFLSLCKVSIVYTLYEINESDIGSKFIWLF